MRIPAAVPDYFIPMRAAFLLAMLLLAACQLRRAPPGHTRVELGNCRCADGTRTTDPAPVLLLDVSKIPEQVRFQIELVDRTGRRVSAGRAIRSEKFVIYEVPVPLPPGTYFVRLNDFREYRLIIQSAVAAAP